MSTKTTLCNLLLMLLCCYSGLAQTTLTADFTIDKPGGCAPLAVRFTNTTTGASSNATFSWEFGNGNLAILKDPAAVYELPDTYSITLTVRDGGKTSTKTQTITVYKKPTVSFNASEVKGCLPLPVTFTSTSTPGDGEIASLMWGFGDGAVQETGTQPITHTYTEPTKAGVSLTVTNSYGCQSTILTKEMVNILPELVASFVPKDTFLCQITDAASFTNRSTGPGNLTYSWDFGDGETSSAREPSHVYKTKGSYLVTLKVSSSEGCNTESVQHATLHVANFKSEIQVEEPLCRLNEIVFKNQSSPYAAKSHWIIDNKAYDLNGDDSIKTYFQETGEKIIKLTSDFGPCKLATERIVNVYQVPELKGFLIREHTPCCAPVKITFTDTTAEAVKWKWYVYHTDYDSANLKEITREYDYNTKYYINLEVTNKHGCQSSITKSFKVSPPRVKIIPTKKDPDHYHVYLCGKEKLGLKTESTIAIKDYFWDFGDGYTSTLATPEHSYAKEGNYQIILRYKLENGCEGEEQYLGSVSVTDEISNDFNVGSTDICGNTPVTFTALNNYSDGVNYVWTFGDGETATSIHSNKTQLHKYEKAGVFTVQLITQRGSCSDTIEKKNLLTVSPPFPKITEKNNTCAGNRDEVQLIQRSKETDIWHWDFGDGTTLSLNNDQEKITHRFPKTGIYNVVLTNKNGKCTVKDSLSVDVLTKQNPVIQTNRAVACSIGVDLELKITNLENNPTYYYSYPYLWESVLYKKGSDTLSYPLHLELYSLPYLNYGNFLEMVKEGFKIVTISSVFRCRDTSNYIPLKIVGPNAGFMQGESPNCKNNLAISLIDTSDLSNSAESVKRIWTFGDGEIDSVSNAKIVTHQYAYSYNYSAELNITDKNGCSSNYTRYINFSEGILKAQFSNSITDISPGTTIYFNNETISSDPDATVFLWNLGEGKTVNTLNASYTYTKPGKYKITLIAHNKIRNCRDTVTTEINVKFVNAAFSFNSNFIGDSKCPPVLARFNNTSNNVSKISWDFGDGTKVDNVFHPNHIYTKAGKYYITLRTWSDNGTLYTTKDSIEIQSSSASIKVNKQHSCASQQITLMADVENVSSYLWDFGDGVVQQASDTFASHLYKTPGIYTPRLILTDPEGCASSVQLRDPVVIDSLSVSLAGIPTNICSPKEILFNPTIVSIAGNQSPQNLTYHWNFGTGLNTDTSNSQTPTFLFTNPGTYPVSVVVKSAYGCVKQSSSKIVVSKGLGAKINGPTEICVGTTASFAGSTQAPGQPKWKWLFDDGTTVNQQNSGPRQYSTPGTFLVRLVVDNQACSDTVNHSITVYANPVVTLNSRAVNLCEGSAVTLSASGGTSFSWSPAPVSGNYNTAAIEVAPINDITYVVNVTNEGGCSNKDSVRVSVVHPFNLQLDNEAFVCAGKALPLNASGAHSYQWINNTSALSNTGIPNPVVNSNQSATYTVVGTDQYKCFNDTASIKVSVSAAPAVNAGPDTMLIGGTSYTMQPSYSNDVKSYKWQPDRYLSCSDCPRPIVTPAQAVTYTLTAVNQYGCISTDTVNIKISCAESKIHIPNAFTPNQDGLNEKFGIRGMGIREIKYFRIYNRFGQLIFEKRNFDLGDPLGDWDGTYKGKPVDPGSYIYMTEMSCNENSFTRKGTVTILY
jgi:gliding motility-associated-like protein